MGLLKHVQNRSVLHKYICMTAGGQKITTYIFTYPKSDKKKCKMVIINVFSTNKDVCIFIPNL